MDKNQNPLKGLSWGQEVLNSGLVTHMEIVSLCRLHRLTVQKYAKGVKIHDSSRFSIEQALRIALQNARQSLEKKLTIIDRLEKNIPTD